MKECKFIGEKSTLIAKYKGKNVKILVSSNITDYDNEFIKLSNVEMISKNMAEIGFAGGLSSKAERASVA